MLKIDDSLTKLGLRFAGLVLLHDSVVTYDFLSRSFDYLLAFLPLCLEILTTNSSKSGWDKIVGQSELAKKKM